MIVQLRGEVTHVDWEQEQLVLDVHGVGYGVHAPRGTLQRLGEVGEVVRVYTHLHVRDDAMLLYGFSSRAERELFELLLSVSKVGPKLALAVLSTFRAKDMRRAVQLEDVTMLTEVPGIGRKTAQRLILELKDKIGAIETDTEQGVSVIPQGQAKSARAEAEEALQALGYSRQEAVQAVERAASETEDDASVEQLVKVGLRQLGNRQSAN